MPSRLLKKQQGERAEELVEEELELHEKLRKGRLKVNCGPDGQGWLPLAWEWLGGQS